ncbi:MAG: hypothetical protein LBD93_07625 [Treponema sp.]|jgi:hypothetical protein|nr:hypothetical protein [Treponema sp.]
MNWVVLKRIAGSAVLAAALGRNMAFLVKSIALGKETFDLSKQEEWIRTNFIEKN